MTNVCEYVERFLFLSSSLQPSFVMKVIICREATSFCTLQPDVTAFKISSANGTLGKTSIELEKEKAIFKICL